VVVSSSSSVTLSSAVVAGGKGGGRASSPVSLSSASGVVVVSSSACGAVSTGGVDGGACVFGPCATVILQSCSVVSSTAALSSSESGFCFLRARRGGGDGGACVDGPCCATVVVLYCSTVAGCCDWSLSVVGAVDTRGSASWRVVANKSLILDGVSWRRESLSLADAGSRTWAALEQIWWIRNRADSSWSSLVAPVFAKGSIADRKRSNSSKADRSARSGDVVVVVGGGGSGGGLSIGLVLGVVPSGAPSRGSSILKMFVMTVGRDTCWR
jgi:hypothetical protein